MLVTDRLGEEVRGVQTSAEQQGMAIRAASSSQTQPWPAPASELTRITVLHRDLPVGEADRGAVLCVPEATVEVQAGQL